MTVTYKQMIAAARPAIPFLNVLPPLNTAAPITNARLSYMQMRAMSHPYDLKVWGAIGDGQSHPLSQRYGSLTAARVVYPLAVALTDQIDLCAAEAAIAAATAAGGGVVTDLDGGIYMQNRTLWWPECGQGISPDGGQPQASVSFQGAGDNRTVFRASADWNGFMWDCVSRLTTQWGSAGFWRDVVLVGAAFGKAGIQRGQKPCLVSGFGWGSRRMMKHCRAQDCFYGIAIAGDQAHFDLCTFRSCFYGIFYDKPNPILFGDHLWSKPIIDQCYMAAVGCHYEAAIPKSQWNTGIFAASPFGIYKEINGANQFCMRQVIMTGVQFENVGHACISGGNGMSPNAAADTMMGAQGDVRPDVQNCVLEKPQLGQWFDEARITGWARAALLDIGTLQQGFTIRGINEPNLATPGDVATFRFQQAVNLRIEGDIETLIYNGDVANKPWIVVEQYRSDSIFLRHGESWEGWMRSVNGSPAGYNFGDCLVHAGGNVQRSAGSSTECFAGVLMQVPVTDYEYVAVAKRYQRGPVNTTQTSGTLDNTALYSGPGGRFTTAANGTRGTTVLGWAYPGTAGTLGKQDAVIQ